MGTFIDLTGQKFGRLLALARVGSKGGAIWRVRCDCGAELVVACNTLRSGNTKSCGCLNRERIATLTLRHGHGRRSGRSLTYRSWKEIRTRTTNPKRPEYPRYGGKGIRMCERWNVFENFLADMGERPGKEYCASRIDHDRDYEPGNVIWQTLAENSREPRLRHAAQSRDGGWT